MATVTSATALDLRTVRVVFSAAVDPTALGVSVWSLAGTSTPPFALPTVTLTDGVDSDTAPTSVDLGLSFDLSPGASYVVTATGVTGVSSPNNQAAFVAPELAATTGRAFSFLKWIPEMNLREDSTRDLRNFLSVMDETLVLLLNDVDRFGEIQDPDQAPEHDLDQMLEDFGNPVSDASLTLTKKRLWMKTLVAFYKQIGTIPGYINAFRFFLGLESSVLVLNRKGMRLGSSLLAVDWILGTGDARWKIIIYVNTPNGRAFTDYEKRVRDQIVKAMSYAHETVEVRPALPAPTGVSAAAQGTPDGIVVSWSAVTGATSYAVYEGHATGVGPRNSSRWPVSGVSLAFNMVAGLTRYFVVVAINAQGEGLTSSEVHATSG